MERTLTLKSSPALWCVLPTLALVSLQVIPEFSTQGNISTWYSGAFGANTALLICGPMAAGLSAWDVGRLRRAKVFDIAIVRSPLSVCTAAAVPGFAVGFLGIAESWMIAAISLRSLPGFPSVGLLGIALLAVTACSAIGSLAGRYLPAPMATPLCLLLGYCWFAFPQALDPLWLHHLSGFEWGCCTPEVEIAVNGAFAPAILYLAATASIMLVLSAARLSTGRVLTSTCVGALGVGVTAALVMPFGADVVKARDDATTCATSAGPTVCVWPEHEAQLPAVVREASAVHGALRDLAVTPSKASESGFDDTEWVFGISSESGAGDIKRALAMGIVPSPTESCIDRHPEVWGAYEASLALVYSAAGVDVPPSAYDEEDSAVSTQVEKLARLPAPERRAWLASQMQSIASCNAERDPS